MEMVGDWNPRGGVTPEEKQAEWRRLSDRAYSPLCFRSQARPAGFSFPLYYTRGPLHLRTDVHTHVYPCVFPPSLCLRTAAHTEPSVFHPRGRLVDLPLSTSAIQSWEQLHAPFGAVSFLSFLPSCSCIRLLCIQLIRKLFLSLSI